jgi:hypothetical protein
MARETQRLTCAEVVPCPVNRYTLRGDHQQAVRGCVRPKEDCHSRKTDWSGARKNNNTAPRHISDIGGVSQGHPALSVVKARVVAWVGW